MTDSFPESSSVNKNKIDSSIQKLIPPTKNLKAPWPEDEIPIVLNGSLLGFYKYPRE